MWRAARQLAATAMLKAVLPASFHHRSDEYHCGTVDRYTRPLAAAPWYSFF